jgi:hypothetical protein
MNSNGLQNRKYSKTIRRIKKYISNVFYQLKELTANTGQENDPHSNLQHREGRLLTHKRTDKMKDMTPPCDNNDSKKGRLPT